MKTVSSPQPKTKESVLVYQQQKFLQQLLDGLHDFDATHAREAIKQPSQIKPYLTTRKGWGVPCFYLLHLILLSLDLMAATGTETKTRDDILNEMSDEDIAVLKGCIAVAKTRTKYDTTRAAKVIEHDGNNSMSTSLKITVAVAESWFDAVNALKCWEEDIANFVRRVKEPKQEVIVPEINPVDKVQSVPVKKGPGRPKKVTSENVAADVLLRPATKISGLVDIAAFKAYLDVLQKVCDEAASKLNAVTAEYKNIEKAVIKEKDSTKRAKLISELTKANNGLVKAQTNFEKCSGDFKKAQSLLNERQIKMAALLETDAKIVELLKSINTKAK